MDEAQRLQKVLAQAGLGSRRQVEAWITEGRIEINGKPAQLGDRVTAEDKILLNGKIVKPFKRASQTRVLLYHKPEGLVCTRRDPEGRPDIFRDLPKLNKGRWITIGRLDLNTSGLLIVTTNGELANKLMHPSGEIEREYAVRVLGKVTEETLEQLVKGVELEDGSANFDVIEESGGSGANRWYHVILKEGRNREVRRMWEAVGLKVSRLIRVRYGDYVLGRSIRPGKYKELERKEVNQLLKSMGLDAEDAGEQRPRSRAKKALPSRKTSRRGNPRKER